MRYLFSFVALLFIATGVFAQATGEIPAPETIMEWVGALPIYLGSWPGVAISFPFLAAMVIGALNLTEAKKFVKYLATGFVGVVLLLLAYFIPFGYLHGAFWWWIPVNFVGLMLLEVLGYVLLGNVMDKIAEKFNPWKPAPVEEGD